MNRSILIVICDFLLLSLLTFSTDINHMADQNTAPPTRLAMSMNIAASSGNDLANVMKQALTEEQKNRKQLEEELAMAKNSNSLQLSQLTASSQQNAQLEQQFADAQTNIQKLNQQLQNNFNQSQQQLASAAAEMQRQSAAAAALRAQLEELTQSNQMALSQKQALTNQLLLAEEQARAAKEKAALMEDEIQAARAENAKLAEGFKSLATNTSQLTAEIRENHPLAPNTIFSDFLTNRVVASIKGVRTGMFMMDTHSDKKTKTVLVTDGTNYFALCHVKDTPLTLYDPGTDWDKLQGTLSLRGAQVPIHSLSFDAEDPRIVIIPVSKSEAHELGCQVYKLASDPYRFQDAVLVGAGGDYYGLCNFRIAPNTPQYLKLNRNLLKGLFGQFNPSRGDLVFSRTGELLGIMVNDTYCLSVRGFLATATFPFDQNLASRQTGPTLAMLYDYVYRLPLRLQ